MLLNVGNVIGRSNQIADYDRKHFGSSIEGVEPQNLEEIGNMLQKWNSDLFHESNCSLSGFKYIKKYKISPKEVHDESHKEEKIKLKMVAVHHLAHQLLNENRAPNQQEMEFVHHIFLGFAELFPGESNAEVRANFHQMAIHPNLMIACSESYMKEIAQKLGRSIEYEFSIERLISKNSAKIVGVPGSFHKTLQKWSSDLFFDGYYTQEGQDLLKRDLKFPDYSKLSYVETWVDTITYIMRLVNSRVESKSEITADDHQLILNVLKGCKERFIQLNKDHNLYLQLSEDTRKCDSITLELKENREGLQRIVAILDTRIKKSEGILKEATDCVYYYPRLTPFLTERIQSENSELEMLKKRKESVVNEGREKEAKLQEQLAKAKIEKESARKETEKALISEDLARTVDESHILEMDSLMENVELLADIYKTFLNYAKGRYDRALKAPSSELGSVPVELGARPAPAWYQRFSLW